MKSCAFFGHRICPDYISTRIREILIDLIENHCVEVFYVGKQGMFDSIVLNVLRELAQIYPHIRYYVVLERMPDKSNAYTAYKYYETILPESIENVHPKYAISWRNRWMIKQSDYVVTYITHSQGGAAQFSEMAKRQNKTVINIIT